MRHGTKFDSEPRLYYTCEMLLAGVQAARAYKNEMIRQSGVSSLPQASDAAKSTTANKAAGVQHAYCNTLRPASAGSEASCPTYMAGHILAGLTTGMGGGLTPQSGPYKAPLPLSSAQQGACAFAASGGTQASPFGKAPASSGALPGQTPESGPAIIQGGALSDQQATEVLTLTLKCLCIQHEDVPH